MGGKTTINFIPNCPIPKVLTYNSLGNERKKIGVGKFYSIEEEFSPYIDDESINGYFRDLREYLPQLATFYLKMQGKRKGALKWFGETEGRFLVAFGGGGMDVLLEKNESACSFLISFLNVGKRVASNSDNFLVFGGNVEETSPVVKST